MNAAANAMPLFYDKTVILNANEHGNLHLAGNNRYAFAKNTNCVPVVLPEFSSLLPFYPVVFTNGCNPMPVTIVGIRNDENLFVDATGNWRSDTYIPAYVRRYPFILTRVADRNYVLGAELDFDFLGNTGEDLFVDEKPADAAKRAFRFCMEYQRAWEDTKNFCKEVYDAGLLSEKVCNIKTKSGASLKLTGFSAVDEDKLATLDNRTANDWRKRNLLKYLYLHISSLSCVDRFPSLLAMPAESASENGGA